MTSARWIAWSGGALALLLVTLVLTTRRPHRAEQPALPPMTGSCATGLGTMSLCSEWSGVTTPGKHACSVLAGTWNETPCAPDVSSAGGTCVVRRADGAGLIHYGSAWSVASVTMQSQTRAMQQCSAQHGEYYP